MPQQHSSDNGQEENTDKKTSNFDLKFIISLQLEYTLESFQYFINQILKEYR